MIGGLGWQELLIVLVIVALVFGASRVADLGGALGRGIREFRQEAATPSEGSDDGVKAETPRDAAPPANETADTSSDRESSG